VILGVLTGVRFHSEADGVQDQDANSNPLNSWTVTLTPTLTNVAPGWYKISEQVSLASSGEVYEPLGYGKAITESAAA